MSGCRKMDAMMASWETDGIRIGYSSSDSPSTADLDADSGLPAYANEAVYMNLAERIADTLGKAISANATVKAKTAYRKLLNAAASKALEYQYPGTLPRGAGQKNWRMGVGAFTPEPVEPLTTGDDGEIDSNN